MLPDVVRLLVSLINTTGGQTKLSCLPNISHHPVRYFTHILSEMLWSFWRNCRNSPCQVPWPPFPLHRLRRTFRQGAELCLRGAAPGDERTTPGPIKERAPSDCAGFALRPRDVSRRDQSHCFWCTGPLLFPRRDSYCVAIRVGIEGVLRRGKGHTSGQLQLQGGKREFGFVLCLWHFTLFGGQGNQGIY